MAETQLKDFHNLFSLDGEVVLVTGGSRGLGLSGAAGYASQALFTFLLSLHLETPWNSSHCGRVFQLTICLVHAVDGGC